IASTGFFDVPDNGGDHSTDPIYTFDNEVQFSDGAPDYLIQINGPKPKQISVYYPYRKYVLPAIAAVHDLLAFYPVQGTTPYTAASVVVWVGPGHGIEWGWRPVDYDALPDPTPEIDPWPAELPPLATLVNVAGYQPKYFQGAAALKFSELPKRF